MTPPSPGGSIRVGRLRPTAERRAQGPTARPDSRSSGAGSELAYLDMRDIQASVTFGNLVRNMHRWGAHLMVFTVFLHMSRVFYHGAYKPPREFNWVVGVILLTLTLLLSFTGYLLPWDQLAVWAVTVGTEMMGFTPVFGKQVQFVLLGTAGRTGIPSTVQRPVCSEAGAKVVVADFNVDTPMPRGALEQLAYASLWLASLPVLVRDRNDPARRRGLHQPLTAASGVVR